jgi:SAM-dependent methyltransferase
MHGTGRRPASGRQAGRRQQAGRGRRPGARGGAAMFASCLPGLAQLVAGQIDALPGLRTTGSGCDGRSDLVLFEAAAGHREPALGLRTTEDVFAETGRARRGAAGTARPGAAGAARLVAVELWQPEQVARALSAWAGPGRPLAGSMTFRVIARVLSEQDFPRTELRRQLTRLIQAGKPRWRQADPAHLEVWASEYRPGSFVAGLRLTDAAMRQHGGREAERPGALRPTLAAAMVGLAGQPSGLLLDPCCGSGTILAEAAAAGWTARGIDIDPDAVAAARLNAPAAQTFTGDARATGLAAGSAAACVTNLPFGRQYLVPGDPARWLTAVLAELARVTRPGGRVVLLAPGIPGRCVPAMLRPDRSLGVRLLGTATTVWTYQRRAVA